MSFKKVFGRFCPKHEIANVPKSAYKMLLIRYLLLAVSAISTQLYCFVFTASTNAIENGAILLGLGLFILYYLRNTVSTAINAVSSTVSSKCDGILAVDLAKRSMDAMSKVSGKLNFNGEYVSNSALLNNIGQYIDKYRQICQAFGSFAINLIVFFVKIKTAF